MLCGDLRLRGASARCKSGERAGNARGAGAVSRSSGRRRLDTSRVRAAGRSRGRSVGKSRALAGQKLEALLTRGTGRQKAKRCAVARFLTVPRNRLAGFGLQALEHDERRFRINGRQAFTGEAIRGPSALGSNASASSSRKKVCASARTPRAGRGDERADRAVRIPTRTCPGVTKRASEVDTVR